MTFKTTATAIALSLAPFAAHAAPYCDALLDPDALPGKYARVAPIHSSTQTGWIFTDQMLTEEYEMKSSNLRLVQGIVDAFEAQDVPLAIMVAPPRTIVAGQSVVDATAGSGAHDVAAAQASFDALIAQLDSTGAIAPNLARVAVNAGDLREDFYFRRDTHWSAIGAALSASALSAEIAEAAPALGVAPAQDLVVSAEAEEEKGSLAAIVRDVCETDPGREAFNLVDFPARGGDLLGGGASDPSVTLLGTSFSNRYKKDFYRVGEALSWALDRDVANLSASGTGMIGMIEGLVLNGGLERQPELVIWETPYTESFNSTSNLRQLLGALQAAGATAETRVAEAEVGGVIEVGSTQPDLLVVHTGTTDPMELRVRVTLTNGDTKTIKLRRRDRVPGEMRSATMAASLAGFSEDIASVEIEVKAGALGQGGQAELHLVWPTGA